MTKRLIYFCIGILSHVLAPNLYIGFGLNIFSFKYLFNFRIARDRHTDDLALSIHILSLQIVLSYSDPRRIRHDLEHAVYAGIVKRIYKTCESEAEAIAELERFKDFKPDCKHYEEDIGYEPEVALHASQPVIVSNEEELEAFLRSQGLSVDDESANRLRALIKSAKSVNEALEAGSKKSDT